jgi:hypothetical protein
VSTAADWDRLVDRYAIATEQVHLAERFSGGAMANAEYLGRPRLKLLDESRRAVRVQNAPPDARRRPPQLLTHWHAAAPPSRSGLEPVGTCHDRPNMLDIDYVLPRSAAGDDLIARLARRDRTDGCCAALLERHRSVDDLVRDVTRRAAPVEQAGTGAAAGSGSSAVRVCWPARIWTVR